MTGQIDAVVADALDVPAPIELRRDALYGLANPVAVDERLTWYPPSARGFTSVNCYLLVEGSEALLVDSGVTVHLDALVAQLQATMPSERLSITHTRLGEYAAICNTIAIAERLPVEGLYSQFTDALGWLEFRTREARSGSWAIGHPPEDRLVTLEGLPVGSDGRRLHAMLAPIRLLPAFWLYDDGSRTLFTGDSFSHAYRDTAEGPWQVDDKALGITPEEVLAHLVTRCWWLPGAQRHADLQREVEEVFSTYRIETIAPGHGCIIHGRREVERHYEMFHDAIAASARRRNA